MEANFNNKMDNVNKLHAQQMEIQNSELIRKRDEAIDNADREVANKYQNDLDTINTQVQPAPVSNDQSFVDNWNQANPWIHEDSPKASYAKDRFAAYQRQGMSAEQSIQAMQVDLDRQIPAVNPKRETQPIVEGGSKPGSAKRGAAKLSMKDLTSDELKYYRAMPGAWKNEAEYLQAVQDTRAIK